MPRRYFDGDKMIGGTILFIGGLIEVLASAYKDLDRLDRLHYTICGLCFMYIGVCRMR